MPSEDRARHGDEVSYDIPSYEVGLVAALGMTFCMLVVVVTMTATQDASQGVVAGVAATTVVTIYFSFQKFSHTGGVSPDE